MNVLTTSFSSHSVHSWVYVPADLRAGTVELFTMFSWQVGVFVAAVDTRQPLNINIIRFFVGNSRDAF